MFSRRDASTPSQPTRDEPLSRTEHAIPAPIPSTPPPAAPAPAPLDSNIHNESVIAQEDTFEGQLKTVTGVRVLGTVRGGIESQRCVRVEAGAHVEADITAEEVVIAGIYKGNLTCRNRVEITSTGRVSGKLDTVKLFLHEGGFFDGELHMQRPSDEPASRPAETEGLRARRPRYTDVTGDNPRPTPELASEVGKTSDSSS
jgi:cytoskeletal protein CcmA (bactofilin family)